MSCTSAYNHLGSAKAEYHLSLIGYLPLPNLHPPRALFSLLVSCNRIVSVGILPMHPCFLAALTAHHTCATESVIQRQTIASRGESSVMSVRAPRTTERVRFQLIVDGIMMCVYDDRILVRASAWLLGIQRWSDDSIRQLDMPWQLDKRITSMAVQRDKIQRRAVLPVFGIDPRHRQSIS